MVLKEDVLGKSDQAIVQEGTELTHTHILFLKKFLIEKVTIEVGSRRKAKQEKAKVTRKPAAKKIEGPFAQLLGEVVQSYRKLFVSWLNNVPLDIYPIRQTFIPYFEEVLKQPFETVLAINRPTEEQAFYYEIIARTSVAIYLADKMKLERKDWLQIGFATLLTDCGLTKLTTNEGALHTLQKDERWNLHPLYSYKMIEDIRTLTKSAKIAVLQHHELLDGTGF